ncbi:TPA: TetR/AcrR family transcriptional regulator [Proteus mirabilis]|uniref:TetR family transcriptional regulator n=1 Tax=Proteus TaxID=583 RepID=UPI00041E7CEF|nr:MULTISPECIES: TetR family transcriptional regulator [Proteus]EJD6329593.1 TetR/AcrR family transcriptional regulator [Proteus mirabilis]EJD6391154.1 TetR/AcrR family transcriptional regulator [Proteus mirabilis]EKT9689002.1 TetR/AcrR family transcriptional regulator [Proteus mirabilis]EKU6780110.1 TetR/AcrR family transcriptional regulator [Proteus mirabilis]EKU7261960.1 TetR/AcrR family transcriptional regulator [Proteus mirabilis]
MKLKSRQQENSEQTRLALLEAGQYLFVNQCYYDVSIDEISRYARVTKGAFYHHFSNKKALLRECYLLQVKHAVQKLDEVPTYDDKWQELTALFSLCVDHIYQCKNELIPLQEVISVLGWKEWEEIDANILIPRIQHCVDILFAEKQICAYSPAIVVNLIYGFITHIAINLKNEASLPKEACSDFKAIFADFLIGVKQASPQRHHHMA